MSTKPWPYAVLFRGRWACPCLAAWLPVYEAELLRRGVIKKSIDIYQLIGGAAASAGTHADGGAYDLAQVTTTAIEVAREMGAAAWHRPYDWDGADGMEHHHGVLNGCPHNEPARYQIAAYTAGYNGLGHLGEAAKDNGPRVMPLRTWQQGIAWAKAQQPPPSVELVHVHHSLNAQKNADGSWKVPTEVAVAWIVKLIAATSADVSTFTEAEQPDLVKKLRAVLGPDWYVRRRSEYLWVTRRSILRRSFAGTTLYHLTHIKGLAEWRQFRVGAATYHLVGPRVKGGRYPALRFPIGHAPAGVEMGGNYRKAAPGSETTLAVQASEAGFKKIGGYIRAGWAKDVVQLPAFDTNLDAHQPTWLHARLEQWLGAKSMWSTHMPAKTIGSHGKNGPGARLIDNIFTLGGRITHASVITKPAKPAALDHRAVRAVHQITGKAA